MRIPKPLRMLCAMLAIAQLAACAGHGSSAIAPNPAPLRAGVPSQMNRIPGFFNAVGRFDLNSGAGTHFVSHDSCPATGTIVYVSDANDSVINIYSGKFAGQSPCGQITSGLHGQYGLYVKSGVHDLYVANRFDSNVLVFHRGQLTPYNTYTDPTDQYVIDVAVAKDGTVITSNQGSQDEEEFGTISTWIGGPNGGAFVGNFEMTNDNYGGWVTVRKNGVVYFSDFDGPPFGQVAVWKMSCPAGACGAQTKLALAAELIYPGGMEFDAKGNLLMSAIDFNLNSWADTFKQPNQTPTNFLMRGEAYGMAVDQLEHHWFSTDFESNEANEYTYPGGKFVGSVPGNRNGFPVGIAVDP